MNAVTKKDTQELMALKRMEKFAVLQSNAHLNMVWVERRIMSVFSPRPSLTRISLSPHLPEDARLKAA